jgi:hypothetical protein
LLRHWLVWSFVLGGGAAGWRSEIHVGDQVCCCLMRARRFSKWRAVWCQPTETNTFEVNIRRHKRLGVLAPSDRRCVRERMAHVSAERNATIPGINGVSTSRSAVCSRPSTGLRLRWNFALPEMPTGLRFGWNMAITGGRLGDGGTMYGTGREGLEQRTGCFPGFTPCCLHVYPQWTRGVLGGLG